MYSGVRLFMHLYVSAAIHLSLFKLTHYDKIKIMPYDSQIVCAKENIKFSYCWPSQCQASAPTNRLKLYVRTIIESEA